MTSQKNSIEISLIKKLYNSLKNSQSLVLQFLRTCMKVCCFWVFPMHSSYLMPEFLLPEKLICKFKFFFNILYLLIKNNDRAHMMYKEVTKLIYSFLHQLQIMIKRILSVFLK